MYIKFLSLVISLQLFSACVAYAQPLEEFFQGALLFDFYEKRDVSEKIVVSPAIASEDDAQEGTYAFNKYILVSGHNRQYIYDFKSLWSATYITKKLDKSFHHNQFTNLFSCDNSACGDIAPWRTVIANDIDLTSNDYHYSVWQRRHYSGKIETVNLFVTDISNSARIYFNYVQSPATNADCFESSAYFYFASSKNIMNYTCKLPVPLPSDLLVLGYTDIKGKKSVNQLLSKDRENFFNKNYLQKKNKEIVSINEIGVSLIDQLMRTDAKYSRRIDLIIKK